MTSVSVVKLQKKFPPNFEELWNSNNEEISKLKLKLQVTVENCWDTFCDDLFHSMLEDISECITNDTQRDLLIDEDVEIHDELITVFLKEKVLRMEKPERKEETTHIN